MPARATLRRTRSAAAFAPGHVTAVFAPDLTARDPRGRGSMGAGVALALGARAVAVWTPGGSRSTVQVRSDVRMPLPISTEVARRLLRGRRGRLEVLIEHQLPIGQGFGMSGSGALAAALAVAEAIGAPTQTARETAHLADLFGGGGLGGVASVLGGGLEIRDRPGVPPFGHVLHVPFRPPLILAVVGRPLPSPGLLRSDRFLDRVRRAADAVLPSIRRRPTPGDLIAAAEKFTDALELASPAMRRRLRALRQTGALASQAMFGNSVMILAENE
ncbi:MAG: hypothetical protein L3J91_05495, partial [Thermoplasmata archaeon]|nr:hypothetical protein [Thermoplasmata archaeon]